jgi:hypothetical protein
LGAKKYDFEFGAIGKFFAIWLGIAPYLCTHCAAKVIKSIFFNFPSLKGSNIVD